LTDPKKREKPEVKTRPAGKLPSGFDKVGARKPDGANVAEILGLSTQTHQPPTTHPPITDHPPTSHPVAPERNFARVPNSVALEAIPAGLFRGESFKTYHALYQRTRAAVIPRRSIRATKGDVMGWADVSHNTLKVHLRYLETAGLVKVHYRRGDRDGMDFEVFIPEERQTTHQPDTHQPPTGHAPQPSQNLGTQTNQNLGVVGESQLFSYQRPDEPDKTSIKTTKDDDEPMPLLRVRVGKRMPKTETVLLALLDTLEARTGGDISSHDALLAHVLRQKLQPKSNTAQRRPPGEPFTPPPVTEYSEEELVELRKIEAAIRAELEGK
jgi:hypothetical protein